MQTRKLTTRLSTIALAIATSACAPHALAQNAQPAAEAAPAAPAEAATPAAPSTRPKDAGRLREEQARRQEEQSLRQEEQSRRQEEQSRRLEEMRVNIEKGIAKGQGDAAKLAADAARMALDTKMKWAFRGPGPDAPVIITTQETDATAAAEWKEDLQVMDKLLRDEVARAGGDDPRAMGIRLTFIGRSAPLYVEGGGVVFSTAVNFPLAPVGAGSGKKDDRPRDPASKWEQAKREISGYPMPPRLRVDGDETTAPMVFEQAKLDQLVTALAKAMTEAANMRHLKENEAVFVTVQGSDEGGAPVRLTLRAAKADVDAAAGGKLSPEEFAKRVTRRIGQIP